MKNKKKQFKRKDDKQLAFNLNSAKQIAGEPSSSEEQANVISLSTHLAGERRRHESAIFAEILGLAQHLQA
jgi:hypothetical protein